MPNSDRGNLKWCQNRVLTSAPSVKGVAAFGINKGEPNESMVGLVEVHCGMVAGKLAVGRDDTEGIRVDGR